MGIRRQAREYSLQLLYQIEFSEQTIDFTLDQFWKEKEVSQEVQEFTQKIFNGTLRNLKEVDGFIENSSTNWKLSRMSSVDRNLLRLASFELLFLDDIPSSVTINEAVEIAKKFGTEESSSFINGVLDKIAKDRV